MVWSCCPAHVFCCAFKVKGIQGDQSQPVAAHHKLSREWNSSKMRWLHLYVLQKGGSIWSRFRKFQLPNMAFPGFFNRGKSLARGGRHPSPGNARQTQVNWTPPANLEATKYYSVQLEWVVCLDDFSIWCEGLFFETVAREWVRFSQKHGTFYTFSILVVVILFLGWGPNLWTP